jgi:thiol-disulfide isomerase/thioredoxin
MRFTCQFQCLIRMSLVLCLWVSDVAQGAHAPVVGDVAPSFVGFGPNGKKVLLDSFAGKVIVISFWATWCPPCRHELPVLANIQKAGQGHIQVIAINTESRETFLSASRLLKEFPIQWTSDEDRRSYDAYGVKGLPHLVVIGKDLRIVSIREGYGPGELDALAAELNAALRVGLTQDARANPGQ